MTFAIAFLACLMANVALMVGHRTYRQLAGWLIVRHRHRLIAKLKIKPTTGKSGDVHHFHEGQCVSCGIPEDQFVKLEAMTGRWLEGTREGAEGIFPPRDHNPPSS